jgi:eukaryotic-like serine/threonine-protein kinase
MAFTPAQGAEPIPGYRLIEKLGSGGFGEVWKATAPGELTKAIKIVFGNLEDQRAEQELKALRRIKEVRHPFLLSLERIEVLEGQLIIVTELADRSLMERFQECRKNGMPGIPRPELLGYLRDAADALDYMQSTRDLQHLDVKPQNLLLVAGRIKVADFGLVKDLAVSTVSAAGGATPVYAPPEAFDGKVSRASDQYSLAIVYQEMLTGTRPFQGESTLQLAMQHVHGRPLLKPLPGQDRSIIARALSKSPEDRFPTCRELIDTLANAKEAATAESLSSTPSWSMATSLTPVKPQPPDGMKAASAPGLLLRAPLSGLLPASVRDLSILVSTVIRQGLQGPPKPLEELRSDTVAGQCGPGSELVRPTLYIGLGGLAGTALRRLKRRFSQRFGEPGGMPLLRMLLVDVDRGALRRAMKGDPREALTPDETLLAPLHAPEHYRDQSRELLRWLDRRWLYGIPRSLRTEGLRPLGRLALIDNSSTILTRLREVIGDLANPSTKAAMLTRGIASRDDPPRIVLVASISGGTGGGMIADMAYAVRQVMADLDLAAEDILGTLVTASSRKQAEREMAQINAYATLAELSHYSEKESIYPGDVERGLRPCGPGVRPFDDCYLMHLGDQVDRTEAEGAADMVAEYLALDATAQAGSSLDQFRSRTRPADGLGLRVFGMRRLASTRDYLGDRAATALCRQVVSLWTEGLSGEENAAIEIQAERLATSLALDAPGLENRFGAAAANFGGGDPLARLEPELIRSLEEFEMAPDGTTNPGATKQVLARLEAFLGVGATPNPAAEAAQASLVGALRGQGSELLTNACQSIAQWLRHLVDSPGERLASAERAADWFAHYVEEQIGAITLRLESVRTQRDYLKARLVEDGGGATRKLSGFFSRSRRRESAETAINPLTRYCRLRLDEFLLDHAQALLYEVSRIIAHLRQELGGCRFEVKALASAIAEATKGPALEDLVALHGLTWLVPGGLSGMPEAEHALMVSMGTNYARHVDRLMQQEILDAHGGLWAVAAGAFCPQGGRGSLVEPLQKAILAHARKAVGALLENFDAATLLVESSGGEEAAWTSLTAQIAAAQPAIAALERPRLLVLALPSSKAGNLLRERASSEALGIPTMIVDSAGDMLVCQEVAGVAPTEALPDSGDNNVAWAPLAARATTRIDVVWSSASCLTTG